MRRTLERTITSVFGIALLAASVAFPSRGVRAQANEPSGGAQLPDAEAERIAEELAEAEDPAVGLAKVQRLTDLGRYLVRTEYRALLETTAERVDAPLVASRLRREAAAVHKDLGSYDPSEGRVLSGEGCLTDWRVVGPFDNDSMRAFETRLPPERGESGPYEGKVTQVDWRRLPDFDQECRYQLGRTIQPSTSAVAYLSGTVESETSREARLLVGAQGAYKIWVDGELVAHQRENLGLHVDNRAWRVDLEEGANRIVVKLASRTDETLGFAARAVGPDLEPVESLEMTAPEAGEAVPAEELAAVEKEQRRPEPTGQGVLERAEACATGEDPSAASWCAGLWRRATSGRAETPWRDVVDRLARPVTSPEESGETKLSARGLARIAGHFDDHGKRLTVLERAREMAPRDPWVGLRLASAYRSSLERLSRRDRRTVLESVRERHPDFWPADLRLAGWYESKRFPEEALRIARAIEVEGARERPAYVSQLAQLESSTGSRERARQLQRQLGEIRASSGSWAWKRYNELTAEGERRAALEIARRRLQRHPLSRQWGMKEVAMLRSLGKSEEALVRIQRMIEQMPGDVGLRRDKAELLVASGQTQDAIAVLEAAVELDPQNSRIREYLSALQTEDRPFHEPWMIDDVRAYAGRYPAGSFADDTVIDQSIVYVAPNGLSQRVVQRVDRAITSEGVEAARNLSVSYTRGDERVEVIDVKVYKPDGTVLEDYDQWRSGRSKKSGPYYNDQRSLGIQANNVEKGDLVEYRYRVREIANENFRGDYFGDLNYVQGTRPVGFSRYVVEAPEDWELHFREPALDHETVGASAVDGAAVPENYRVHGFELEEIPAVDTDARQPGHADVYDYILVSNKETWDEVGEWWWNLIEEQLIVNDAIAETVDEVTEGLEKDRRKVEALHNHLVKNTRYLHVGLGIHGWKPYRTTQCFRNKYGDCKDKSSLLKVMLEEAGIETNLVLVRTRRLGSVGDHPPSMHIFNHAINYIPSLDLYLDPTAEYNGTRQLPPMDQGAQALIVEDGGETEFTRLPVDSPGDNVLIRELDVDLSKDPSVTTGHLVARGQNAVYYRRDLENPDRRDEELEKQLADIYPGAELVSADYKNLDELEKPVEIHFEFEGGRIERTSNGKDYIFPYGSPKDLRERFADQAERDQDLKIRVPFSNETTMRFHLSDRRGFSRVPEPVQIESEFGAISIDYERRDGSLVAEIRYEISVQRVPVEKYGAFRSFLSRATSELNETIRLTDETTE